MEQELIIYTGLTEEKIYTRAIASHFRVQFIPGGETPEKTCLNSAVVLVIGADVLNPASLVQKVFALDKHLSIIVLASPAKLMATRQAIQFSPFVGKNALVIPLSPETDIESVCAAAATRTRQKRSFSRIELPAAQPAQTRHRGKLSQMGDFLEHAPIGSLLVDSLNRIVNYNQYARKMFPMLNKLDVDLESLFPKSAAAEITAFIRDHHDPETRIEIEVQSKILELTTTAIYNEEGVPLHLVLLTDVTEQRLETQRIHSVLEGLPQMAWTTTPEGAADHFTHAWYQYTGQTAEQSKGTGWIRAVHPEDIDRLREAWQQSVASGKPLQQAARYRDHKGGYRWHLTRASAVRNSARTIMLWVGTCTDIHDQISLTEELERKVKERTRSLEVSNNELEQFAHISSHDLQEPLRKIRTFAGILSDSSGALLDENGKRYLKKINDTADRMSRSLKALLDYTQAHRADKYEKTDLDEVVGHVLLDLELVISQKKAVIHKEGLPVIEAAAIQMQQLFYNLINNALKFSQPGIPPVITIGCREVAQEELTRFPSLMPYTLHYEISVSDNGIGFEQEYAEKIFTIFQRLHSRSAFDGTGIGLSLVKRIVHNHNGEVYAHSSAGEGASFHVILPARRLSTND